LKIAVLSDGSAEALAITHLLRKIAIPDAQLLDAKYSNMQPKDTAAQIARQALVTINILRARGVDRFVVILDREDRGECPGAWSASVEQALNALGVMNVSVAIKNRKFENWLIADPAAISGINGFSVSRARRQLVEPNKADHVTDAERWLSDCVRDGYKKGVHPERICRAASYGVMAANSRSFRRFLRILGYPLYRLQSRRVA